jgi:hypothetical protein
MGTDSVFRAVCEKWLSVPGFRVPFFTPFAKKERKKRLATDERG